MARRHQPIRMIMGNILLIEKEKTRIAATLRHQRTRQALAARQPRRLTRSRQNHETRRNHTHAGTDEPRPEAGIAARGAPKEGATVTLEPQPAAPNLVTRTLHEVVKYPPHGPREDDVHYKIFEHAKRHLVHVLGVGCWIGGATHTQIQAGLPAGRRCHGATQLEAHHAVAEYAGLSEMDWRKVARDFPQANIQSDEDFLRFAESEGGLMIICDHHHRDPHHGIHSITYPAWLLDKYAKDDYEFIPDTPTGTAAPTSSDPSA